MNRTINCLNCEASLGEVTPIHENGAVALVPGTSPELEYEEETGWYFKVCPKCKKRNGFERSEYEGLPGLKLFALLD